MSGDLLVNHYEQEPLSTLVSMNMSGRFASKEIRRYGQQIIKYMLEEKNVGLFFGQQTNFKPSLPKHYDFIGNSRAFIVYSKRLFKVCDEKQYRHYLRDLELQRRLPRHYLPEANFVIAKVKTRSKTKPKHEFIALSVLTDECMGRLKATSQMRKIVAFVENLSMLEQLPVVVSGTFRISSDDARRVMSENMRPCSYLPSNKRRAFRFSNFFLTSKEIGLSNVKPIVCSKIELPGDGMGEKWVNPEDAFYWDPVIGSLDFVPEKPEYKHRPMPPQFSVSSMPDYEEIIASVYEDYDAPMHSRRSAKSSYNLHDNLPDDSRKSRRSKSAPRSSDKSRSPYGLPPTLVEPPRPPSVRMGGSSDNLLEGCPEDLLDGNNIRKLSNGDSVPSESGTVMERIPSYAELYDEELMESNAVVALPLPHSTAATGLPIIWKLERIHYLLMALTDELQNIQLKLERPVVVMGNNQFYQKVWY